jgi:HicB family
MRKPTEIVQINLRLKEGLRRKLECAAKGQGISLNQAIRERLEDSFERAAKQSLESLAFDIQRHWDRFRELVLTGGMISTLKELNKSLEQILELECAKQDPELSRRVHAAQALLITRLPHQKEGGNT